MIDYTKISEYKAMPARKGKTAFDDYSVSEFGIKLDRGLKFDAMLLQFEAELMKKGIEYKDPAAKMEEIIKEELKPEVKAIIDEFVGKEVVITSADIIVDVKPKFELEADFVPAFALIGYRTGYYTLSWWIYEWIEQNPNWKEIIPSYPRESEISILKTLLYYINKNGFVTVRETRNSRFIDLF